MEYASLKLIHMSCALMSYTLFFLRGVWRFSGSRLVDQRWVRILPHVIDTVLLVSAIGLAMTVAAYPGMHDFLAAKVAGLLIYIALGLTAFRFARTRSLQVTTWILAQIAFFYIVAVAITKSPRIFG